jgi:Leucine-rich repeat (LRR) protein
MFRYSETNKFPIYKNDLKFQDKFDLEYSEFDTDGVEEIYNDYSKKPKIEFRLKDAEIENYNYIDLSNLGLDDDLFKKLLQLDRIVEVLKKVKFLDLSTNNLTFFPDLTNFKNIIYLNVSFNNINGSFSNNNLEELSCENNSITSITSNSIKKLSASYNSINYINVPNINILIINDNKLEEIKSYEKLEYLECNLNLLCIFENFINLEELYISNNKISRINNIPKLKILNCTSNHMTKINYFEKLETIICSTPQISKKYNIENISKVKNDYLINFIVSK